MVEVPKYTMPEAFAVGLHVLVILSSMITKKLTTRICKIYDNALCLGTKENL